MLLNKDFLTWLLIFWWLCCQPIRCQVWKSRPLVRFGVFHCIHIQCSWPRKEGRVCVAQLRLVWVRMIQRVTTLLQNNQRIIPIAEARKRQVCRLGRALVTNSYQIIIGHGQKGLCKSFYAVALPMTCFVQTTLFEAAEGISGYCPALQVNNGWLLIWRNAVVGTLKRCNPPRNVSVRL